MLYICIGKPRTSCKYRASSVSFCPDVPKNRPGEGATTGWIVFSKCFVVFSKCRIVFRKSFLVSQKQPADCFRRLKTLKLRGLGRPFFRVVKLQNEGVNACRLRPSQGVACFIGAPPARTALYTRKASGPRMYLSLEALLGDFRKRAMDGGVPTSSHAPPAKRDGQVGLISRSTFGRS